jgi:hypothetical protein
VIGGSHQRAWKLSLIVWGFCALIGCARQPDFAANDSALPFYTAAGQSFAEVPPGTLIVVHLQESLSSSVARPGDSFQAVLNEPILLRGRSIAAKGTLITGKILQAKAAEPERESGYLRVSLTEIFIGDKPWSLQTTSLFIKGATYIREATLPPVQLVGASSSGHPSALRSEPATAKPLRLMVREDVGIPAGRLLTFRLSAPAMTAQSQ